MTDKQIIRDKVVIEELLRQVAEGSSSITNEVVKKHYVDAVRNFLNCKVNLTEFFNKCLACGLISSLHWNPETYVSCENRTFLDLKELGISIPSEIGGIK